MEQFIPIPAFLDVMNVANTPTVSAGCSTLCEVTCQGCEGGCESSCQAYCDTYCQSVCETRCQGSCEDSCQSSIQQCGNCEVICTVGQCIRCEDCQSNCEKNCQTNCQEFCTVVCECTNQSGGCQNCESQACGDCQVICQDGLGVTPGTIHIEATNITLYSITVRVKDMSGSHAYSRTFKWYLNGVYKGENTSAPNATQSPAYTFSNLSANTTYQIKAVIHLNDGSTVTLNTEEKTLQSIISKWSWSFSTVANSECAVPASEWLEFCRKINEVRVASGLSNYAFTTDSTYIAPGKLLYPWIFKQAATALNELNSGVSLTACLNVSGEDEVKGSYFDTLKNAVNAAIDKL